MFPLINNHKAGVWFPKEYAYSSKNIKGIYAYMTFVGLGFILGDGVYNILKIFTRIGYDL